MKVMERFHVFALTVLALCLFAFFAPTPSDWKVIFVGCLPGFFLSVGCQGAIHREAR